MKLTAANHVIRNRNVTASEVGALLGEHPYMTAGMIYDRLTIGQDAMVNPRTPTLSMRFGSAAEPILQDLAAERLGVKVRMSSRTFEHPRVRLCATPDAYIVADHGPVVTMNGWDRALVEFKLSFSQHRWSHGLPPDVEWQARAQMACTHRSKVVVYVFCGREYIFTVDRHRGKERAMTQAVEAFWNDHVMKGIRPTEAAPMEIVV